MTKFANILETVGNTPVVRIGKLAPPNVNLYVKIEAFNPHCHAHYLRVNEEADLDAEIARHLQEAYAVGQQKHLA